MSQSHTPSPRANATGCGAYVCIRCEVIFFSCPPNENGGLGRRPVGTAIMPQVRLASAFTWAARRLLCRAALFLWMMPLPAMRSRVEVSARSVASAAGWSAPAIAFCTFLIAVRSVVLRLTFALRCLIDFFARFRACLVLAIWGNSCGIKREAAYYTAQR